MHEYGPGGLLHSINLSFIALFLFREGINKLYTVSFMWYSVISTLTTVFVGLVISALTGKTNFLSQSH